MFRNLKSLLDTDGSYKVNLMADGYGIVCSDQPAGIQITNQTKDDAIIPPGIIVIRNLVTREQCNKITHFADQQPGERLKIMQRDLVTGAIRTEPSDDRITDTVNINETRESISGFLASACHNVLVPHYGIDIEWYETPTLLRYGPGGKYEHHSDSENWNPINQTWSRFCDRAYSLLLYLNDDFTGGSLYFRNFDFRFTPTAGTLVAFPSDHRYVHRAEPVLSGTRYAIVSWIVTKDSRFFTKDKPVPPHAVVLK